MSNSAVSLVASKSDEAEFVQEFLNNSKDSSSVASETGSILSSEINPLKEVVSLEYSFGYDCKQHFNLCVFDENTLVYYSGTLIHIFNIETNTFEFRSSYSQSGIGHIVKNPKKDHLSVGEKCVNPFIIIYDFPSFNIVSKLSGGSTRGYSHLGYSPDGTMLVSQGKEPDHLITVWDWEREQIILRVKSHGQDVFNAEFSQFVPGQLTTSGLGHIKFWKMAKTFTGLKLQGELGRFGKTEICDILGICAMPDEKVISGSEWGNLLVWEDRLIKLEVRQKAKGNCHSAPISQIHFNPATEDIISVGMDGWVKLWTRATIDSADPPDEEDWCLEMQPLVELNVKDELSSAKLMSLCKKNSDPEDSDWFAQDCDGALWKIRLSPEARPPERLLTCHAGEVAGMAASPLGHFLATLGQNGCLLVHDVTSRELLLTKRFKAPGCALIWLPVHVEASGAVLVGGFSDGMLRMFTVSLRELQRARQSRSSITSLKSQVEYVNIIQIVKAHSAAVSVVCLNPRGSILVSGSVDGTIFVHQILPKREYVVLAPIGFIDVSAPVSYITWRPKQKATAILACTDGSLHEITLPERVLSFSSATYQLNLSSTKLQFKSVKSELIRAQELQEIEAKKQVKLERKKGELAKIKADNPNLDIDEELFLMDSDDETEFPPLYYPESPSPILFVMILPSDNLLLSMGGYDCGFLYEYSFEATGPLNSTPVPEALNTPIHCFLPLCDGQLLAMGFASGVVRLTSCTDDKPDMNTYHDLSLHDTEHGQLLQLCTSSDGRYLYSCGADGNVFCYKVNPPTISSPRDSDSANPNPPKTTRLSRRVSSLISGSIPKEIVMDKRGEEELSLEETKRNTEKLNQQKLANERKERVRRKLHHLRLKFEMILHRNSMLPESQILAHSMFELDPRITASLQDKIEAHMALMLRQTAFKVACSRMLVKKMQNHFVDKIASLDVTVRAIKNENLRIKAFTHNKLTPEFLQAEAGLQATRDTKATRSAMSLDLSSRGNSSIITMPRHSGIESMLKIQPFYYKLTLKARKALISRSARRAKLDRRTVQWKLFLEMKPNINTNDPVDVLEFERAVQTIGDFKLKSANTYRVPEDKRITPPQKYWQLQQLHREIYESKEAFNEKVCQVRNSKISLVRRFKQLYSDLDVIQREISPELRKERFPVPKCYLKNNFPEHIFRLEFGEDPQTYHPVFAPYDEQYLVLNVKNGEPVSTDMSKVELFRWTNAITYQVLQSLGAEDAVDTPWEMELKVNRMIRLLHEQDMIITEMRDGIDRFDETLENLSIDRLKYARDIKLMEIFKLTLHQELVVINSYAGQEEEINRRINNCVSLRNDKLRQKVIILEVMDVKQQDIVQWQTKLADIQEEVANKVINSKFATFLNRLFKRKRVIRRTDDSASESSSSEDDTDEDFEDEDNEDFIPIKLDENVCPDGCDQDIYRDIIQCRNLRYEIEDVIIDLRKQLEDHQRELQLCSKELSRLEVEVKTTMEESEAVQFEKQQKLNDIETIVVLNLSQFCHFVSPSHLEQGLVQSPLVFHSEALLTLAGRVRELEKETEEEHVKIQQQKRLMQRLDKRRQEMKEIKKSLKKKIDEEIVRKFGDKIDIDLMEETVLNKMINQARRDYHVDKLREKYDKIIADTKTHLWELTEYLIHSQQENTRRLRMQTMLEQETFKLRQLLRLHSLNKEKTMSLCEAEEHEKDEKQLETILQEQLNYGKQLKEEIKLLKYKCTPPQETRSDRKVFGDGDKLLFAEHVDKKVSEETIIFEETDDLTENKRDSTKQDHVEQKSSQEIIATIDKILYRLASGSSAENVALAIVDEMLELTGASDKRTSAMECALKLVEELIVITTGSGENSGDVTLVEQYTDNLLRITQPEHEPDVDYHEDKLSDSSDEHE